MNISNITEKIIKNAFYNFLISLISRIGALFFTIIVARILFPELFGIYSLALTIILTVATFTDLGINATLIRYLAESLKEISEKSKKKARTRLYFLLNFKILFTLITATLLFLFSDFIALYIFKKPLLALPLKIGSIYLFVISLHGFFNSIFYAIQKVKYSTIGEGIFQLLRIFFVFIFLKTYKSVGTVFVCLILALFISFLFLFLILYSRYNFLLKGKKIKLEKEEKKRLLSFFGWIIISSISLVFFVHVDIFMLGIFLPAEFAGYYNAIFSIVGAAAAFVAFGSVLLPAFTQLKAGRLKHGFNKVIRYASLIAIPASFGLAFVIVPAIKIIYGTAYVPIQYKLAITIASALLSFLVFEAAITAIYSALFQAREMPRIPSILIVIATIVNIILNYVFIKIGISMALQYGLVGAAAATLLARYSNMIGLSVLAKKNLKIKAEIKSLIKPLIASLIMLGFLFVFDYYVTMSVWTGILMIILAILVYFVVMLLIKGIKKEDVEILKTVMRK